MNEHDCGAPVIRSCAAFFFPHISPVTLQFSALSPFLSITWQSITASSHLTMIHISRFPFHHLKITESLLPDPSQSVFFGIFMLTLGRLPVQFQACEEPHSLELRLFLQCQEYSWSLSQAVRNCWNGGAGQSD